MMVQEQMGQARKLFPAAIRSKLPAKIGVVSLSARESLELNRTYRKRRKPANVLSFFYSPEYGEIMVCPELIRAEAEAQGRSFRYQMTWMIVHGMLHLAGIHHEASAQAERRFEEIERRVLEKLGTRSFSETNAPFL